MGMAEILYKDGALYQWKTLMFVVSCIDQSRFRHSFIDGLRTQELGHFESKLFRRDVLTSIHGTKPSCTFQWSQRYLFGIDETICMPTFMDNVLHVMVWEFELVKKLCM